LENQKIMDITLEELRNSFDQSFSIDPEIEKNNLQKALQFHLSGESYAIPLMYIREVRKISHITKVPCAPSIIVGMINLNGEIVSVSNICNLLELSESKITSQSRLIITNNLGFTTALLVDSIQGLIDIKEDEIQPPISTLSSTKAEYIHGGIYCNDKLLILLNMEKLFQSSEMQVE